MIKLLPLLLMFSLGYGENFIYLLPDQNTVLIHKLKTMFKHSRHKILIITPSFHHEALKRSLIEGTNKGARLTLIVRSLDGDPLSLAQYERIDVRVLHGREIQGSIIAVDGHFSCLIPAPIDAELLMKHASLIQCSEQTLDEALLSPFIKRSRPYLQ
ncbi:MAG: hypothetical protein M0P91_00690 [Sulfuricurvum sp.]|jgi:hypothetical protein|uniref:hypothetical protein n=1 Tax=Sulfuricurvum sp. TaxID=2025608 RepID=UPI0025F660F1|nr:hypothetical protein [Sulfuricurvum sp.]MCK9371686.1 hypothetical protein [Sulfuricurvum sp.]